ncbi:DUF6515 family protein [uncultured Prevotella sp.]|uniref:DUF6515 family protein n=1 Tax=uncultured Prevotella sp. TaxID=159272 RepID=UPI00260623AC|nr:DUF6515 family protein [uncultured Prevotella sp.]
MRIFRLLPLLMLLTLTCATTGASTLTETSYVTQPKPKHHKKPHHKAPPHKKPHHKKRPAPPHGRPPGVVIHHNHRPYIYSHGRYYCDRGGTYVVVKPSIGMIVPSLPTGYVTVKRPHGRIVYAFGGVVYEKITSNGAFKFKIVGFL